MNKGFLFILLIIFIAIVSCRNNSTGLEPMGTREPVTGNWLPLTLNDTISVYINNFNNIHLGDPTYEFTMIREARASSFQVWTGSKYARDAQNVYFPIDTECVYMDDKYVCYSTNYIVEGARPQSFRYLGSGFGTDGNDLFLNGVVFRGNNDEGF